MRASRARAEAYGVILCDHIKRLYYEFYYGIMLTLRDITELYYRIILRDNITESYYGLILRDNSMEILDYIHIYI